MSLPSLKNTLIDTLLTELEQGIQRLESCFASTREAAIQAPGRMQSRYDSTKEEQSNLANSLGTQILAQQRALQALQAFRRSGGTASSVVTVGSLVTVQAQHGEDLFFIIPSGSGRTVELEGKEITAISPEAPIAQALLGHSVHETVSLRISSEQRQLTIIDVD